MLPRLKRVEGQILGIQRMILDRRYCVDILIQFQAVASALRSIEKTVFERHLRSCVSEAISMKDESAIEEKTQELVELIFRRLD